MRFEYSVFIVEDCLSNSAILWRKLHFFGYFRQLISFVFRHLCLNIGRVTTICEIKYYNDEFIIDKECYENLINKKEVYLKTSGTKNSLQIVMITSYGLANSKYNNLINKSIKLKDLFIQND